MFNLLKDEHKEHLKFLTNVDAEVVREFCRISLQFIENGANPKVYQGAAQKLDVETKVVQSAVEGLMYLLTETSRFMIPETEYKESLSILGFQDDKIDILLTMYLENRGNIRNILSEMSMELPHYDNLEWRFDVQVASRSMRHQVMPNVLLKLHLEEDDEVTTHHLQTDPGNLVQLTKELEKALDEMKSPFCRRIVRNID
ncbi:COMM domain-containing protein 2 [Octopus bimaculoides]|uniref:COMM domain-containing protein n=1 Tax=Octopus bimaculoides TaxID=37653 RepID=A0A0L8GVV2_OCTBM|nr:COMM domain-containing protein 2 [Octopus bimaculoides]|eukprot:XP_014777667.1 PREDICTED: COMM domain-containing protein 2-like [Octopus bimaculoides]